LYEAVQESDLVICVPWTSPALIAKELGVKTLYYVSDRDYEWDLSQTRNIKLFRDEKNLYAFIRKMVVSKINSGLV
jgi:polysaccharide biosynthesis PFTS motif protein